MFNKEFLVRLGKEMLIAFVVVAGTAVLAGTGLGGALLAAAVIAGVRGAVGVAVRNVGELENHPSV